MFRIHFENYFRIIGICPFLNVNIIIFIVILNHGYIYTHRYFYTIVLMEGIFKN